MEQPMNETKLDCAASAVERLVMRFNAWRHAKQYLYGYILRAEDGYYRDNVRLNKSTGRIEFVLWKAGEQGHASDYWHEMGIGWELHFKPHNAALTGAEGVRVEGTVMQRED